MKDYYKILEISPDASQEVIHMAYKALAKKYHPDTNTVDSNKMQEINEAYGVLSNKEVKEQYDQMRMESIKMSLNKNNTSTSSRYATQQTVAPGNMVQKRNNGCCLGGILKFLIIGIVIIGIGSKVLYKSDESSVVQPSIEMETEISTEISSTSGTSIGKEDVNLKEEIAQKLEILDEKINTESTTGLPYDEPVEASSKVYDSCLLDDSSERLLVFDDVAAFNSRELYIAMDEILARHGVAFENELIMHYFNNKSWYSPRRTVYELDKNELSDIELQNIEFLKGVSSGKINYGTEVPGVVFNLDVYVEHTMLPGDSSFDIYIDEMKIGEVEKGKAKTYIIYIEEGSHTLKVQKGLVHAEHNFEIKSSDINDMSITCRHDGMTGIVLSGYWDSYHDIDEEIYLDLIAAAKSAAEAEIEKEITADDYIDFVRYSRIGIEGALGYILESTCSNIKWEFTPKRDISEVYFYGIDRNNDTIEIWYGFDIENNQGGFLKYAVNGSLTEGAWATDAFLYDIEVHYRHDMEGYSSDAYDIDNQFADAVIIDAVPVEPVDEFELAHKVSQEEAQNIDYESYYGPILDEVIEKYGLEHVYAFYDMDADNVKELIVEVGGSREYSSYKYYTIYGDYPMELGTSDIEHTYYIAEEGQGLYAVYNSEWHNEVDQITKDLTGISTVSVVENGDISGYTTRILEMYAVTDREILHK